MAHVIRTELARHAPFTALGTLSGIAIMVLIAFVGMPRTVSQGLFWTLHPLHVLLSALVTTAVYVMHGRHSVWSVLLIGYIDRKSVV